ncbi:MAG: ABC transporter permease subunit [Lentisphaerae bacterium]|nr:ABC transporter permease subunit [Lentisphaerota bacterium]
MITTVVQQPTGGPARPARLRGFALSSRLKRRLVADGVARRVVTLGGMIIIGSILSILIVIIGQVYPLFAPPSVEPAVNVTLASGPPLRVGIDEYQTVAYRVGAEGVSFHALKDGAPLPLGGELALGDARVTCVSQGGDDQFALGLSDGRVLPVAVHFDVEHVAGQREVTPQLRVRDPVLVYEHGAAVRLLAYAVTPAGPVMATVTGADRIVLTAVEETTSLMDETTSTTVQYAVPDGISGEITALAMDQRGDDLFVGTAAGAVWRLDLRDKADVQVGGSPVQAASAPGAGISALQFLIGDRTLVVGDSGGGVSTWQMLRAGADARHLVRVNTFAPHAGRIVAIQASRRDKGFLALDDRGVIHLNYGTTGKTLLTLPPVADAAALAYAPKADGILAVGAQGGLQTWALKNRHPEITLKSLFGKIWYEGYDAPAYVWQSTGGSDDFEAKFSLTPLLYGTLKGTLYALLFAVPLALLGALYASQFMHPNLRQRVKPVVEIMAALPSVVLGFIAGLWLAPNMEKIVPGIFLMPFVMAGCILAALVLWRRCPRAVRHWVKPGYEFMLLIPVVLGGGWLAIQLGAGVEHVFLQGDYRHWLLSVLGLTFDQRNSLVVGFAMGFAVVPIIFTIAEDSLSSVPQHLRAASLALGATPWQTAIRVVLPTASPGIFSAVMIGLGRAVGETMIVLMATGNTPVMDLSIFSGFRAMSANIAVELPEAPDGGTLFRVLFVAALLLFMLTFIMNTAAELIRLRLRKRYRYL